MSIHELKEIINPTAFENIINSSVTLNEPDKNSKLKSINLKNLPKDIIVLKGDSFQLNTIFINGKPFIKRCDFLIATDDTLFFIELKTQEITSKTKFKNVEAQFKTVECIIDLVDSVIIRFSNSSFRLNKLDKKFFLFYHNPSIAKTKTSLKGYYDKYGNNTPEKFHSIPVSNDEDIYLQELQ